MAILIEKSGEVVKKIPENSEVFNDEEILKIFESGYKFTDMGIFVVITNAPEIEDGLNEVATLFLRYPVYGNILVLTGQELNSDFDIVTNDNSKNAPREQDEGVLVLLKETLMSFQLVTGMQSETDNIKENETYDKKEKSVMFFDPRKVKTEELTEEDEAFLEDFFESAYQKITKTKDIPNAILYDGDTYIIKLAKERIEDSLNLMLEYFIEKEAYEKSAKIRDIINNKNLLKNE